MSASFLVLVGILVLYGALSVSPSRRRKINQIIKDLEILLTKAPKRQHYAIRENIHFFKAIKTVPGYIYWALTRRRNIDPQRLLEIADLPLPRWEQELYTNLAEVERKDFPGLSKPLRNLLLEQIETKPASLMLDLGCGGMEVERQVMVECQKRNVNHKTIFIGVDSAPQAWEAILMTFADLEEFIDVKQIRDINIKEVKNLKIDRPTVFFHCGDALEIAKFHGHYFDTILSSRFRHHLSDEQKVLFDHISLEIANRAIEYDDYQSAFSWLLPPTTAWFKPVLLNGAIFSQIRQPKKRELKIVKAKNKRVDIAIYNPPGSYARISTKQ